MLKVPSGEVSLFPLVFPDIADVMAIEGDDAFAWTYGNFRDCLEAGYSAWALRSGPELAGYLVLMPAGEEMHLLKITVAASCRRHGYGRGLLQQAVTIARRHGAHTLLLEVRPSNVAAVRLYETSGFRRIGRRRDYYVSGPLREDALVFSCEVNGHGQ